MQTNILDWLEATSARCPDAPAVGDDQTDCTWAQLDDTARRAGSFLASRTMPRRLQRSDACSHALAERFDRYTGSRLYLLACIHVTGLDRGRSRHIQQESANAQSLHFASLSFRCRAGNAARGKGQ